MQTNHTRSAGAFAAVIAAACVGYTLRPSAQPAALAERSAAAEVRTVVIRRTIHIVRHERARPPVRLAGAAGAGAGQPATPRGTTPVAAAPVRTSTSHHAASSPAPAGGQPPTAATPLKTTTSKHSTTQSRPTSSSGTPSAPVTTRTSRTGSAGGGTTKPVMTRTSAKGHGDDGGRDGSDD